MLQRLFQSGIMESEGAQILLAPLLSFAVAGGRRLRCCLNHFTDQRGRAETSDLHLSEAGLQTKTLQITSINLNERDGDAQGLRLL